MSIFWVTILITLKFYGLYLYFSNILTFIIFWLFYELSNIYFKRLSNIFLLYISTIFLKYRMLNHSHVLLQFI